MAEFLRRCRAARFHPALPPAGSSPGISVRTGPGCLSSTGSPLEMISFPSGPKICRRALSSPAFERLRERGLYWLGAEKKNAPAAPAAQPANKTRVKLGGSTAISAAKDINLTTVHQRTFGSYLLLRIYLALPLFRSST